MNTKDSNSREIFSVILPTYNEFKNIPNLIDKLLNLNLSFELELIFIDDNSSDGTGKLIRDYSILDRRIRLINRVGRSGLSSAIKEGCLCASGEIICIMDTDGQHKVEHIENSIDCLINNRCDVVTGSRFLDNAILSGLSNQRTYGSNLANYFARLSLYGSYSHLTDYMTGFLIFRRNSCINLIENIDVNGFKFLYELLSSSNGTLKIREIPLNFEKREYGKSKLDQSIVWDFFISLIHSFLRRLIPRRAISFAFVGVTGVIVQIIVVYFLMWMTNISFGKALPFGVIVAASSNYTINNFFTFRSNKLKGRSFYYGLFKFLLVSSLPIIANVGVSNVFYNQFSANSLLSQIAGILVVFIWNYAASSKIVWNF